MTSAVQDKRATSGQVARTISPRAVSVLTVVTAMAVTVAWLLARWITQGKLTFRKPDAVVLAAAAALVILGSVVRSPRLRTLVAQACAGTLAVVFVIYAVEAACRVARIDFGREEAYFNSLPVYYRWPILHAGEGIFRRPGPDQWTGQVLRAGMVAERYADDAYADEKPLTIKYDDLGFRNPPDLKDWDVVVVGDSFTELGFLPDEELFSSIVAGRLGKRVKNLGVCHTGPLTHLFYARHYGKSPSTRHAILCFFEGNDLTDLKQEQERLDDFRRTGQPEPRNFQRHTSVLRAVRAMLDRKPTTLARNAYVSYGDREDGVTVKYTPPGRAQMTPAERALLESTLQQWGRSMSAMGMKPWVVYMPCKRRILHGRLRFADDAPQWLVQWEPSDLPDYVRTICADAGISFVDAIPPLLREVEQGRMCYNLIKDTHLNALGSRVVADLIADALRPEFAPTTAVAAAMTPK